MAHCYRCWRSGPNLRCCSKCRKWMCDDCRANYVQRGIDAAYEKIFGYSKDWAVDGEC